MLQLPTIIEPTFNSIFGDITRSLVVGYIKDSNGQLSDLDYRQLSLCRDYFNRQLQDLRAHPVWRQNMEVSYDHLSLVLQRTIDLINESFSLPYTHEQ